MPYTETKQKGYVLFPKPNEAKFDIALNSNTPIALRNTFQEKIYLQQLQTFGSPLIYRLRKHKTSNQYYLLGLDDEIIQGPHIFPVCAFVILEIEEHLELRLGNTNHLFVSGHAPTVKAAGDIHFSNGHIVKITDQSGGYNVSITDPMAREKRASAKAAMTAVQLPMDKFVPFVVEPERSKPLLFSKGPFSATTTAHPHTHNAAKLQPVSKGM